MICFQLMVPLLAYTLIFFSFVYIFEMLLGSLYKALDFQAAALEAKMLSSLSAAALQSTSALTSTKTGALIPRN